MEPIRPKIYTEELAVYPYNKSIPAEDALRLLQKGNFILVEDYYSSGLKLMAALKNAIKNTEISDFAASRQARKEYRNLSHRVLLEVENHSLIVKKGPDIPWLKKLFPGLTYFAISFPDIQALNSSWQIYSKGMSISGLNHNIHPYYGVYYPTRFDHIELFSNWLESNNFSAKTAYDIGCGSGILSFLLEKAGLEKVWATDINPNAILGLNESIAKQGYKNIDVYHGNLFVNIGQKAELIVFNPPWLPEQSHNNLIDRAVYYPEELFPEFFSEALHHLTKNGRLIILFSNLLSQTHPDATHPIKKELIDNKRFEKLNLFTKKVLKGSAKTKRNTTKRAEEIVELWELKPVKHD